MMIVRDLNIYLVLLFLLVHFNVVRFNLFWKVSPFIVLLAAAGRPVHPDGLGRAAGRRAGRCATPLRSCPTSRAR